MISATSGILSRLALESYKSLMRLRLPELLEDRDLTPYGLHKRSSGRISLSTAYRLVRQRGQVKLFDAELLEALCDILGVEPGELLERGKKRRR